GLNALVPRGFRIARPGKHLRNRARRLAAHLMAARAAVGVDDVADPLALALDVGRDAVALFAGAGEIALRRHLHQRVPVLCRVVLRRRSSVTTLLIRRVGVFLVSAITNTPASGPRAPVTTPPMSSLSIAGAPAFGCCPEVTITSDATSAPTPSVMVVQPRRIISGII